MSNPIAAYSIPGSQVRKARFTHKSFPGEGVRVPTLLGPISVGAHSTFSQFLLGIMASMEYYSPGNIILLGILLMQLFQRWVLGCILSLKVVNSGVPDMPLGTGPMEGSIPSCCQGFSWARYCPAGWSLQTRPAKGGARCMRITQFGKYGRCHPAYQLPRTSDGVLGAQAPPHTFVESCWLDPTTLRWWHTSTDRGGLSFGAVCICSHFRWCMFLVASTRLWICYPGGPIFNKTFNNTASLF